MCRVVGAPVVRSVGMCSAAAAETSCDIHDQVPPQTPQRRFAGLISKLLLIAVNS